MRALSVGRRAALLRSSLHSLSRAERRVCIDSSAPLYSISTVVPDMIEVDERRGKGVEGKSSGSGSVHERLRDSGVGGSERSGSSGCSSDMVGKGEHPWVSELGLVEPFEEVRIRLMRETLAADGGGGA